MTRNATHGHGVRSLETNGAVAAAETLADDDDPRHPALEAARRPDLEEALVLADDLDLIATVDTTDLA
jgi:hypothetical protein